MSFRKRLSRLAAARVEQSSIIESATVNTQDDIAPNRDEPGDNHKVQPHGPETELQHLRARLGSELGLQPQASKQLPNSEAVLQVESYNFEWREGPGGRFRSHRRHFKGETKHGQHPFFLAEKADMSLLSLLSKTPDLRDCEPRSALYFDTETTGLGGAGTLAFLIGCLWLDQAGHWVVEEIFLNDPSEEAAALDYFAYRVRVASYLVSYNGKSFDLPLLNSRRVMQRQAHLDKKPHLDLLHLVRRLHRSRLKSFRLPQLEVEILGFHRPSTDIPGAEIAPLYFHYLRSQDIRQLAAVFEHNEWDLLSMAGLCGFYGESLETWFENGKLQSAELIAAAQVISRQKDHDLALPLLKTAGADEGNPSATMARAFVHKARGDKYHALVDFENALQNSTLSQTIEPLNKRGRLELAKLYEHHLKDFDLALSIVSQGTIEAQGAHEHRAARLERKNRRKKGE